MSEQNKYLTEAMGACWHKYKGYNTTCIKCGTSMARQGQFDFSKWEVFGKLWEWAQEQEWFTEFILLEHERVPHRMHQEDKWVVPLINPICMATRVCKFLKER